MINEIVERLELVKAEEYTTTQLVDFIGVSGSDVISVESIVIDFENEVISAEEAAEKIETYI